MRRCAAGVGRACRACLLSSGGGWRATQHAKTVCLHPYWLDEVFANMTEIPAQKRAWVEARKKLCVPA
jgi:hypothetical protein